MKEKETNRSQIEVRGAGIKGKFTPGEFGKFYKFERNNNNKIAQ